METQSILGLLDITATNLLSPYASTWKYTRPGGACPKTLESLRGVETLIRLSTMCQFIIMKIFVISTLLMGKSIFTGLAFAEVKVEQGALKNIRVLLICYWVAHPATVHVWLCPGG